MTFGGGEDGIGFDVSGFGEVGVSLISAQKCNAHQVTVASAHAGSEGIFSVESPTMIPLPLSLHHTAVRFRTCQMSMLHRHEVRDRLSSSRGTVRKPTSRAHRGKRDAAEGSMTQIGSFGPLRRSEGVGSTHAYGCRSGPTGGQKLGNGCAAGYAWSGWDRAGALAGQARWTREPAGRLRCRQPRRRSRPFAGSSPSGPRQRYPRFPADSGGFGTEARGRRPKRCAPASVYLHLTP
jgi:hypothetical protein